MATVSRLVPYVWHFRQRNLDGRLLRAVKNGLMSAFSCLVRHCAPLAAAKPGQLSPGSVRVSPGYNLPARDCISRLGDTC